MSTSMLKPFAMILWVALGCSSGSKEPATNEPESGPGSSVLADVVSVSTSGEAGAYTFSVTIESPDSGCERYANWWEVLSEEGELFYRRILAHSHVEEQPFMRSGGPVNVAVDQPLIVRAHLERGGVGSYGGIEFKGTVASGFVRSEGTATIASSVETAAPQPTGCAF